MSALCIVEDPSTGGMYTKVVAPHAGGIFEKVGYVAEAPLPGVAESGANFLRLGEPVVGYTHFLLVGSPEFIARQPAPAGGRYGAYVLADTQFLPAEHLGWIEYIPRIAVPSQMTGAAIKLSLGTDVAYKEVRPWGFPLAPRSVINRTEIRQLLVPGWTHAAPVILAYAEFASTMCAMLSRTSNVNLLLLGEPDSQQGVRLDMCGIESSRVQFTVSQLAWDASDLYVALNPFTTWPWDVTYAISRQLPCAAINTHVYETLIEGVGCVGKIPAFDTVTVGNKLGYQANSTDIANALSGFVSDPANLHARTAIAARSFAENTPARFTRAVIEALFAV